MMPNPGDETSKVSEASAASHTTAAPAALELRSSPFAEASSPMAHLLTSKAPGLLSDISHLRDELLLDDVRLIEAPAALHSAI